MIKIDNLIDFLPELTIFIVQWMHFSFNTD